VELQMKLAEVKLLVYWALLMQTQTVHIDRL
jgi:hypothetical protein